MWGWTDTLTDILPEGSARCVQSFDDSLDFAIRMTYRISLRSSSLWEPRHPLLKVFFRLWIDTSRHSLEGLFVSCMYKLFTSHYVVLNDFKSMELYLWGNGVILWPINWCFGGYTERKKEKRCLTIFFPFLGFFERCGNDPSAGSPTETLLRLHLPLNDEV